MMLVLISLKYSSCLKKNKIKKPNQPKQRNHPLEQRSKALIVFIQSHTEEVKNT